MRILVVEDEVELADSIGYGLRLDGYEVDIRYDGENAWDILNYEPFDLVILDLNLPFIDGFELLVRLRTINTQIQVLILSARGQLEDKVCGLDMGANDYLVKPFHFAELEARVRSLLRRQTIQNNIVLECGNLSLDTKARIAYTNGQPLVLTRKEIGLLEYLLLNQQRIVSQEELIQHVWDGSVDGFSNSVRVHISALRKKLRLALGYDPIENHIGQGYKLKEVNK